MNHIVTFSGLDADDAFRRAQEIADFLRRLASGDLPSDDELSSAPVIDEWRPAVRPEPCLVGVISGHPSNGHMRPGCTSGLHAMAPERWVRTTSRLYRLARPADFDGRMQ